MMNAFSAGSNADISTQNIDMATGMLNKQSSKPSLPQNNGFMMSPSEEIYGNSTAAGTSKPAFDSSREAGIVGSIKQTSSKMTAPLLLNQPSADSFAQIEEKRNNRNREIEEADDWDAPDEIRDIEDDDTKVPIPMSHAMLGLGDEPFHG